MICYNHIERAGGTTLNWIFRNNFPFGYLALQPFPNVFTPFELKSLLRLLPWTKCFGGHNIRQYMFYEGAINRPIEYITFLRNPVERFLSHYQYQLNVMKKQIAIIDFIRTPKFQNFMTFRIAGSYDIEKAKDELLNRYSFVGCTDRFDESLILMKACVGLTGFDTRYVRKNTLHLPPGSRTIHSLFDDDIMSEIQHINQLDQELYHFALDKLWPKYFSFVTRNFTNELQRHQLDCQSFQFSFSRKWLWRIYRYLITNPLRRFFYFKYHRKVDKDNQLTY